MSRGASREAPDAAVLLPSRTPHKLPLELPPQAEGAFFCRLPVDADRFGPVTVIKDRCGRDDLLTTSQPLPACRLA
jgi:hypothetical protein